MTQSTSHWANCITDWLHTAQVFYFLYSFQHHSWGKLSHILSIFQGYCWGIQMLKKIDSDLCCFFGQIGIFFMQFLYFSAFDKHLCKKYAILFCILTVTKRNIIIHVSPVYTFFFFFKSFSDFCVFLMARTGVDLKAQNLHNNRRQSRYAASSQQRQQGEQPKRYLQQANKGIKNTGDNFWKGQTLKCQWEYQG